MKKRLLSLFIGLVFIFPFFCVTGCSEPTLLVFRNSFYEGKTPDKPYAETLTYNVEYTKNTLSTLFAYNEEENYAYNDMVKFSFSDGKYTSKLSITPQKPQQLSEIESDIFDGDIKSKMYYHLICNFEIVANYHVTGEQPIAHKDTITQEVYFCDSNLAFAPIYSKTISDYTILSYTQDEAFTQNVKTSYEIVYNISNYTINSTSVIDDNINDKRTSSNTYEYTFRTAIDNNQLLFLIRNTEISNDSRANLPTISLNYGEAQDVEIYNKTTTKETFDINFNGVNFKEEINYKELYFYLENINASGATQKLFVQAKQSENFKSLALPVIYEESLIAYSSFSPMGTLKYTLKSVVTE